MKELRLHEVEVLLSSQIQAKHRNSSLASASFRLGPIELDITSGEIFVILGASGCGKSTLLRSIAGLTKVHAGQIWFKERDITYQAPELRGIGMVFQQPLLFPHLNVLDNVAFGLKMKKERKHVRLAKAQEMLQHVEMNEYGDRFPHELSGGQQQRVALARALVMQPHLLLLDEPFSAVEPMLREEMGQLLIRLHRLVKMTILFVTHDQTEAFRLGHRLAIMQAGQIMQVGYPQEVYERPNDPSVARFLGIKNSWEGTVQQGYFKKHDFRLELPKSELSSFSPMNPMSKVQVMFRAEAFSTYPRQTSKHVAQLEGVIEDIEYRQGLIYVNVRVASERVQFIEKASTHIAIKRDETITLYYHPEDLLIFPLSPVL